MSRRRRKLTVERWSDNVEEYVRRLTDMGFDERMRQFRAGARARGVPLEHFITSNAAESQSSWDFIRCGRQVYLFDREFMGSILDERWEDLLPDVIENAPHECFYMHLPCDENSSGVVVRIGPAENVADFQRDGFFDEAERMGRGVLHDDDPRNPVIVNTGERMYVVLMQAIPKTMSQMYDDVDYGIYPSQLLVNGVTYICSKNADIHVTYKPDPQAKRSGKRENRYSRATWHEVGYHIGAELREYERTKSKGSGHQGGSVRPHMRRAHWHHYWVGPKAGRRELVLKWVGPTVVGASSGSKVETTAHKVA